MKWTQNVEVTSACLFYVTAEHVAVKYDFDVFLAREKFSDKNRFRFG
jgi:hypothetical protein